ncbi:hypothetical protein CGMCC3_g16829 [Colletotrichum fructicola]|nr:uncharacterized protein CGMCC3_g16829 [Colletotrichum fructicola]KAE9567036.1 hypothetical protein CGMCC3_g16829 [Colletotrichum fructicola]
MPLSRKEVQSFVAFGVVLGSVAVLATFLVASRRLKRNYENANLVTLQFLTALFLLVIGYFILLWPTLIYYIAAVCFFIIFIVSSLVIKALRKLACPSWTDREDNSRRQLFSAAGRPPAVVWDYYTYYVVYAVGGGWHGPQKEPSDRGSVNAAELSTLPSTGIPDRPAHGV